MNWFKQNPVAFALLILAVIGTGATSYFAVDATARRDEAQSNLDSQIQKLKQFQNQKPFPTEQSLKAVKESLEEYRTELGKYRTALVAMEATLTPINPQEFQDDLRKAVDELRKTAIEKGVTLPDNFFYGFDEYQSMPPSQQEVGELNREFGIMRRIADELVDLKIGSIGSLKRQEIVAQAPATTPMTPAKPGATPEPKAPAISCKTFIITFTAPQEKVLTAFNMIQDADEFLLIRSLTLDNTSPQPPLRTQPGDASTSSGLSVLEPSEKNSETIQAILGRESVMASLTIEILDFPDWESKPPAQSKATPPPK
jgi:outer membrane protein OmpA-like peptidoglycan-associated protein